VKYNLTKTILNLSVICALLTLGSGVFAQETKEANRPVAEKAETLGIVKEKPESGPAIEIEGGFMVPYEATIPGTDVKYTMLPIPGGKFMMGSPEDEEDRNDDEGPQFEVTVEPFWMGKYEVTWAEYKKYMGLYENFQAMQRSGIRKVTAENEVDAVTSPSSLYDAEFTYAEGEGPKEPAATMSQFAAKQYTKWLSKISGSFYRLPTEAEWEYACRAGTTTPFYFGDDMGDLEDHCWHEENSEEVRTDCGQLKPNPWGLYDMYGNVAEWVLDQYDEDGYTHVEEGASVTVMEAFRKPTTLFPRVARGGSWESVPEECRSASRLASEEMWRNEDPNNPKSPWWHTDSPALGVGFRVIRPLNVPKTQKEKNAFWDADVESIMDDVKSRIEFQGKGAYGVADPGLPKDIEDLDK
jgi:formylglycine-generating enzyme required for sulfatase activity